LRAQTGPAPGRPQEEKRFGSPPLSPEERERFRQRLGITAQQQEQMEALFAEAHKQRRELGKKLWELFDQRNKVCDTYDFDRSKERALRAEILKVHQQLLKINLDTEEKLRRILNREQFEKLRAARAEAMQNMKKFRHRGERMPPPP
jgi:Spy/CpxP family protein refolding chaperone